MIGKVISGSSFSGTVGYVMKKESRILEAEGVMPPDAKRMAEDFKDQTLLNPRLKNTVGHISLSFSPKYASRMTDALMTQIAKEYMQRMGITDTQYLLVRHLDQPHPHCHLVYNRVGNDGQTIPDNNIRYRNVKVCRKLTEKYGLYLAPGKDDVRRERLREPDRIRYEIYDTIRQELPRCRNWNELRVRLKRHGIETIFKRKGAQGIIEGVKFARNGFVFSGSKVDRAFSFTKLDNRFNHIQQQTQHRATLFGNLSAAAGNYRSAFAGLFGGGRSFSAAGGGGGGRSHGAGSMSLGSAGSIPLPPFDSPFALSPEMMQRREGESPEEHIARITALINKAAEAMAIALMERKRRLEARSRKIG